MQVMPSRATWLRSQDLGDERDRVLALLAEEPIFGHQVSIAQAEFLIDGTPN